MRNAIIFVIALVTFLLAIAGVVLVPTLYLANEELKQQIDNCPACTPPKDENLTYCPEGLSMPEGFNSWPWWERTRWAKSRNKSDYRDTEYWPNPVE